MNGLNMAKLLTITRKILLVVIDDILLQIQKINSLIKYSDPQLMVINNNNRQSNCSSSLM